ncbi:hypothetical protein B0H13DRAFT_2089687 [Mycena leptocephala]|nr:hypothetical protein B0H13DRAFT_2089687 [Mycena leptocephala]
MYSYSSIFVYYLFCVPAGSLLHPHSHSARLPAFQRGLAPPLTARPVRTCDMHYVPSYTQVTMQFTFLCYLACALSQIRL